MTPAEVMASERERLQAAARVYVSQGDESAKLLAMAAVAYTKAREAYLASIGRDDLK